MNAKNTALLLTMLVPSGLMLLVAGSPQSKIKDAGQKAAKKAANAPTFEKDVLPLVKQFCVGCHQGKDAASGVVLSGFTDKASMLKKRAVWEHAAENIRSGHMPPANMPQPTPAQRNLVVGWVESTLSQVDCQVNDPGRVTMRRLNRAEYNNTVRDLTGLDLRPADEFPLDDVGYGFDNIGDVLSLSPLLMEKYINAADKVARAALAAPEAFRKVTQFAGTKLQGDGSPIDNGARFLSSTGQIYAEYDFPKDGEYTFRFRAYGDQAGPEAVKSGVMLDGQEIRQVEIKATVNAPKVYELKLKAPAGRHKVGVTFLNDYYVPAGPGQKEADRNMGVFSLEIEEPSRMPSTLPALNQKLAMLTAKTGSKEEAARVLIGDFARRAFRRPVTKPEVDRLMLALKVAEKEGESLERGIQVALQATLCSSRFLFRVEADNEPKSAAKKRSLSDFELASRLSYFLWSSMPDETLFQLAAQGKLKDPNVLATQAKRMLKDPKARALAENFAGQWLQLRNLRNVTPDPTRFPEFNDELRDSMRTETEMFFTAIAREDRSVMEFLDSRFTFLNEPLAKLYGIEGVSGKNFRRVQLASADRGGLLTQASVLTVTSNPTRTSPVKRGKWVLEQILGTPPPPPPPNVPELADDKKGPLTGTLRQRMEQHRKNAICASCHARMDPIGFGLENFNAVGKWRTQDGDSKVDASGTLPSGKSFNGPAELKTILKGRKNEFVRCLSEKMLTYAIGRGVERTDKCKVDDIVAAVTKNDYRFSEMVRAVVISEPFRMRKVDGGK